MFAIQWYVDEKEQGGPTGRFESSEAALVRGEYLMKSEQPNVTFSVKELK